MARSIIDRCIQMGITNQPERVALFLQLTRLNNAAREWDSALTALISGTRKTGAWDGAEADRLANANAEMSAAIKALLV